MINGFLLEDGHFISCIRVTSMRQSITLRSCFTELVFASWEKREISGRCVFDEQHYYFVLENKYSPGVVAKTRHTLTHTSRHRKIVAVQTMCWSMIYCTWAFSTILSFRLISGGNVFAVKLFECEFISTKGVSRNRSKNSNSLLLMASLGSNRNLYSFFVWKRCRWPLRMPILIQIFSLDRPQIIKQ